jgi:hypothetical protein
VKDQDKYLADYGETISYLRRGVLALPTNRTIASVCATGNQPPPQPPGLTYRGFKKDKQNEKSIQEDNRRLKKDKQNEKSMQEDKRREMQKKDKMRYSGTTVNDCPKQYTPVPTREDQARAVSDRHFMIPLSILGVKPMMKERSRYRVDGDCLRLTAESEALILPCLLTWRCVWSNAMAN